MENYSCLGAFLLGERGKSYFNLTATTFYVRKKGALKCLWDKLCFEGGERLVEEYNTDIARSSDTGGCDP